MPLLGRQARVTLAELTPGQASDILRFAFTFAFHNMLVTSLASRPAFKLVLDFRF